MRTHNTHVMNPSLGRLTYAHSNCIMEGWGCTESTLPISGMFSATKVELRDFFVTLTRTRITRKLNHHDERGWKASSASSWFFKTFLSSLYLLLFTRGGGKWRGRIQKADAPEIPLEQCPTARSFWRRTGPSLGLSHPGRTAAAGRGTVTLLSCGHPMARGRGLPWVGSWV